jgi:hypothetical protein
MFKYFGGPIVVSESYVLQPALIGTSLAYQLNLELTGGWRRLAGRLQSRCDRGLTVWLRVLRRTLEGEATPAEIGAAAI